MCVVCVCVSLEMDAGEGIIWAMSATITHAANWLGEGRGGGWCRHWRQHQMGRVSNEEAIGWLEDVRIIG